MASKKIAFEINLDASQASKSIGDLESSISGLKDNLKEAEVGSKAFQDIAEAIDAAESKLEGFNDTLNGTIGGVKAFDSEVLDTAKTLGGLEQGIEDAKKSLAGLEIGSDEFNKIAKSIQGAEQRVKDFELEFESLDFEQKLTAGFDSLTAVAGGFAAAEGAAALFGAESEALEETLIKVTGALALAQGLRDVGNGIIAFRKLAKQNQALNKVVKVGTTIQKGFNKVLKASPLFLLVTVLAAVAGGIGILILAWKEWGQAIDGAAIKQRQFNKIQKEAEESYGGQVALIEKYKEVAQDASKTDEERAQAVRELEKELDVANGTLGDANGLTEEAIGLVDEHTESIKANARAKAAQQLVEENAIKLLEAENVAVQEASTSWDLFAVVSGNVGVATDVQNASRQKSIDLAEVELDKSTELVLQFQKEADAGTEKEEAKEEAAADADKKSSARSAARKSAADKAQAEQDKLDALAQKAREEEARKRAAFLLAQLNLEEEINFRRQTAEDQAITKRQQQFDAEIAKAEGNAELEKEVLTDLLQDIADIEDKFRQERIAADEAARDKKDADDKAARDKKTAEELAAREEELDNLQGKLDFANAANDAFVKDEAARNKIRKALALAQIAIDTARAVSAAIASGAGIGFPQNIPAIIAGVTAVLSGIASAKAILGEAGDVDVSSIGGSAAAGAGGVPIDSLNQASTLIDNSNQDRQTRVIVVESDITDTQNTVATIEEQATI